MELYFLLTLTDPDVLFVDNDTAAVLYVAVNPSFSGNETSIEPDTVFIAEFVVNISESESDTEPLVLYISNPFTTPEIVTLPLTVFAESVSVEIEDTVT